MLIEEAIEQIRTAHHGDPFSVLGPHADATGATSLRVFLPGAEAVAVIEATTGRTLARLLRVHTDGFFDGVVLPAPANAAAPTGRLNYRLQVRWADGNESIVDDPYRFPPVLGELDVWLLGEGSHLRPYEVLGAVERVFEDVPGTSFAVWAPNASKVSVVGDFNLWDGRRNPMRLRRECGAWELFVPAVGSGARYKYEIRARDGHLLPLHADPYALQCELRPGTASVVARLPATTPESEERKVANQHGAPMSVYEVHLGSWRRVPEEGDRFLNWEELAEQLVPYAQEMGFTHLELMPVSEFPFDGSWGYQPVGLYAPTARFGNPAGFKRFVEKAHAAGLGVLLDWVPAHFPSDAHGLAFFDGTHLFEYADPREGFHIDWETLIYNFGRTEVRNFLVANALFWLERYNVDGLRVDAVASMLYRDYSRRAGEWVANAEGGRENLEAIAFLKRMNEVIGVARPQAVTIAEESTAFAGVSRPTYAGGLGFQYKWNMGWMPDTLAYMSRDTIHRRHHHHEMTFGLVYAFDENFVLPLSHDEVVHGKGSLIKKMPGDRWQKFANLRAYYGFMYGHPGKKLLFMGSEIAQEREWNHDRSLDWHELGDSLNLGVQRLVRDLNRVYRDYGALHELDFTPSGFEWIDHSDGDNSVVSFVRRGRDGSSMMLVVSSFTPMVRTGYRVGVPSAGTYRERLNTDSAFYGGSNVGTPYGVAQSEPVPWNGRDQSVVLTLPPLATVFLEWTA
ncbi:1,4-alpha-glucan branching enzyme [soil metagenome]